MCCNLLINVYTATLFVQWMRELLGIEHPLIIKYLLKQTIVCQLSFQIKTQQPSAAIVYEKVSWKKLLLWFIRSNKKFYPQFQWRLMLLIILLLFEKVYDFNNKSRKCCCTWWFNGKINYRKFHVKFFVKFLNSSSCIFNYFTIIEGSLLDSQWTTSTGLLNIKKRAFQFYH